ncbi:MAG: hypothetical protein ACYCY6_02780 [Minisyncoccota bacterium]
MFRLKNKLMGATLLLSLFAMAAGVNAQTVAPRVAIQLLSSGLTSPLEENDEDAIMARLVLDTTGSTEAVRISSLPFILSTGSGAEASTIENCTVVNESNSSVDLSDESGGLVSGLNPMVLRSPLVLAAGTVTTLSLRCDITEDLVTGGTFTFSMNTSNVNATGVSTGVPAVVSVRGAAPTPVPVPVPVPVPGVPNTGAGGEVATNLALILGSIGTAGIGLLIARKTARIK